MFNKRFKLTIDAIFLLLIKLYTSVLVAILRDCSLKIVAKIFRCVTAKVNGVSADDNG